MSWRKLFEINLDYRPRTPEAMRQFAEGLWDFAGGGDKRLLPRGITFLESRHHSDPAPTGWRPPQDRARSYRCMGLCRGKWRFVAWETDEYARHPRPYWMIEGGSISESRGAQPTEFLPEPLPTVRGAEAGPPSTLPLEPGE